MHQALGYAPTIQQRSRAGAAAMPSPKSQTSEDETHHNLREVNAVMGKVTGSKRLFCLSLQIIASQELAGPRRSLTLLGAAYVMTRFERTWLNLSEGQCSGSLENQGESGTILSWAARQRSDCEGPCESPWRIYIIMRNVLNIQYKPVTSKITKMIG